MNHLEVLNETSALEPCAIYTETPRAFKHWLFRHKKMMTAAVFTEQYDGSIVALFHLHSLVAQRQKILECIRHHDYVLVIADQSNPLEAIELFKMGIKGYLESDIPLFALEQAIATIRQGNVWIGHDIMSALIRGVHSNIHEATNSETWSRHLTARETETANALLQGKSNKEIAELMDISERTVKSHIRNLFDKFEVNDRLALVVKIQATMKLSE